MVAAVTLRMAETSARVRPSRANRVNPRAPAFKPEATRASSVRSNGRYVPASPVMSVASLANRCCCTSWHRPSSAGWRAWAALAAAAIAGGNCLIASAYFVGSLSLCASANPESPSLSVPIAAAAARPAAGTSSNDPDAVAATCQLSQKPDRSLVAFPGATRSCSFSSVVCTCAGSRSVGVSRSASPTWSRR
ncbi:hypothetical protein CF165_42600 [Amycolatopsis vastitatis]|uniref:Uncharacterized protein n=1 Tax=Amycolatopsis vastitatis TaxID=1905142 RepID=A0A229SNX1_9PSEU|nr:hypothetical protein CF165_42600 [Amycolatopsis vastitatis]